jgi:hypothetical protein
MKTYLEYLAEAEAHAEVHKGDRKLDAKSGDSYSTDPKMDTEYADGLGRVDVFHHPAQADKAHTLYRMMLATAESDGTPDQTLSTNANSFSDVSNFATPFSEVEGKMLDKAYKHLGIPAKTNVTKDEKRHENKDVYKVSPHRKVGPITLKRK